VIGSLIGVIVPREVATGVEPVHRNKKMAALTCGLAHDRSAATFTVASGWPPGSNARPIRQRPTVLVLLMESSILSEVDDTSILRTVLSTCYWHALDWLPASRLTPPRSGLERSDFVPWPISDVGGAAVLQCTLH
jgi:hypothetical protein